MGLHICYEMRLPGALSDAEAIRRLEQLQEFASTLQVPIVTEVVTMSGHEIAGGYERQETLTLEWILVVTSETVREERDGHTGPITDGARVAVAAFMMNPGDGSEPAAFGIVRPALSHVPRDPSADMAADGDKWLWHYCCKTQYASTISDEHLVRCHTAVVRVLEEAQRLGFGVTVRDETHYWETRSEDRLIAEVRNMNRIVARFAGAFHDEHGAEHSIEAPIFENPDFERLETEPIDPPKSGDG